MGRCVVCDNCREVTNRWFKIQIEAERDFMNIAGMVSLIGGFEMFMCPKCFRKRMTKED